MIPASAQGCILADNVELCITTSKADLSTTLASAVVRSQVPSGPKMQRDIGPGTLYAVADALSVTAAMTAASQNLQVHPARVNFLLIRCCWGVLRRDCRGYLQWYMYRSVFANPCDRGSRPTSVRLTSEKAADPRLAARSSSHSLLSSLHQQVFALCIEYSEVRMNWKSTFPLCEIRPA